MYTQFSLTVNEGKWLIAHAVSRMACVRESLEKGRLILKGGTTVSCISEIIMKYPLGISGRITDRGALGQKRLSSVPHIIQIEKGQITGIDDCVDEVLLDLGPMDTVVTGANIIDSYGEAAMLAGSPGGNKWGKAASALSSEGVNVIIAAGLEKLIPGRVHDSIMLSRRKGIDHSKGMASGLFSITGKIVTEVEAIKALADVDVTIIGRGGIYGAEGGTLFQVSGTDDEVSKLENVISLCSEQKIGGDIETLESCTYPGPGCGTHLSCCYKSKG